MNAAESVDWLPALAALGVGLLLGAVLVWRVVSTSRTTARAATGGLSAVEARDLEGKRDALLRQLRELEDTASKRTSEQLARERYDLELEAAGVLLALDKCFGSAKAKWTPTAAASTSTSAGPAPSDGAGRRGFLWGAGSASALLFLAFLVYQSAKPREAGGSVTGDVPMGGGGAGRQTAGSDEAADPTEAQIQASLARNPDDIDAHLALARVYVGRRDMMSAWNETKQVLDRAPGNPQALAYQALVRLAMGQPDVALDLIKKALASDPNLIDGYIYRALVYVRMGRMQDAEASIAEASKRFPERAAGLRRLLADLKKPDSAMTAAGSAAGEDPHASPGPPGNAGSAAPAAAAPSGHRISGTVDIDPLLKGTVAPGAILFVFVREAGFGAGPPVAAKRLPARFPAAFEITEADAMMGQPFPDSLLIEARLDEDGDPTTRPPTDPKARLDDVKTGRTDVRLVLRRP